MMSQLLLRLDRELESATDPDLVAELAARKAGALARLGRFPEALATIKRLREMNADWTHARAHVWIMLAEGIVKWHSDLSPQALDRITRAQVLSVAMRYDKVIAISSAWKAHIEFDMSNFDAMFRSIRLALKHASSGDNDVHARISIDLCNVLYVCGDWSAARVWFGEGREFALNEGDQASIEALQYNRAAFSLMWARIEGFDGGVNTERLRDIRLEMNSARNLQMLMRQVALKSHLDLCDARLCVLEGRYEVALTGIRACVGAAPFANYNFNESLVSLEAAYCQFKLGQLDLALDSSRQIDSGALLELDIDERFIASCMLLEMCKADPRFGSADSMAIQHQELREAHLKSRADLSALAKKFCEETRGSQEAV
jgi:tetratricopeptide (TPR) repeat protein